MAEKEKQASAGPEKLAEKIKKELQEAASLSELEKVRIAYFGKKGFFKKYFSRIKNLSLKERKEAATAAQRAKTEAELFFSRKELELKSREAEKKLRQEAEDIGTSIPKVGHLHPITRTIRMMNSLFTSMGFSIVDGPEMEDDEHCFKRLNVPENHPARGMQDTIYIKEPNFLLRTQTSSIEARALEQYKPPFKIVCPGRVYRNEKANKSNHFIFHHYQGVVVAKEASLKDLFGTLTMLFKKMYGPKAEIRYRNKYYPEVEPGVGPDMKCFRCRGKGCSLCKGHF